MIKHTPEKPKMPKNYQVVLVVRTKVKTEGKVLAKASMNSSTISDC